VDYDKTSMAHISMMIHYGQTWHLSTIAQWRQDWLSASVINHTTVTKPTIWRPGFDLLSYVVSA